MILGPDEKPVQSDKFAPCPRCGRPSKERIPSSSFGENIYMICPCGNEFNKEIKWEKSTQ